MQKPIIMIGCPVQNRADVIGRYLEHIYKLDYPKDRIILSFFVNNSTDSTSCIINNFFKENKDKYLDCLYFEDKKIYKGRTDPQTRTKKRDYILFSLVRNRWLSYIKQYHFDYLLSIDSDILISHDALDRLVENNKDLCSALVYNGMFWGTHYYNFQIQDPEGIYYMPDKIPTKLFEVPVTGACILIKKEVLDKNIKYGFHKQGEDVYFCEKAKNKGYKIYCNPTIKTTHLLIGDQR